MVSSARIDITASVFMCSRWSVLNVAKNVSAWRIFTTIRGNLLGRGATRASRRGGPGKISPTNLGASRQSQMPDDVGIVAPFFGAGNQYRYGSISSSGKALNTPGRLVAIAGCR